MPMILARYRGRCYCGARFIEGDAVDWNNNRVEQCPACIPRRKRLAERTINKPLPNTTAWGDVIPLPVEQSKIPRQGWRKFFDNLKG